MLTINLDLPLKSLDETEIADSNMSKLLANLLIASNKGPAIKYYDWAQSLWRKGIMQLDRTDLEIVRQLISDSEQLTILGKAQLLQRISDQEKSHQPDEK